MSDERNTGLLENVNQLYPELLGLVVNMVPWAGFVSPSRLIMLGNQVAQALLTRGNNRNRFFVGVEQEYAKYTFKIAIGKGNYRVLGAVNKYKDGVKKFSAKVNPRVTLVLQNRVSGEIDIVEVLTYAAFHNNFGWEYKWAEDIKSRFIPGANIEEGYVLAETPGVQDGLYTCTTLSTIAYVSTHYTTEDGFMASNEWCDENVSTGYGEVWIEVPKGWYMTNVYGEDGLFKPCPNPGEPIRQDGLLAVIRKFDDIYGVVDLTEEGMRYQDHSFDRPYYIEAGCHNARVVDIDVWRSDESRADTQPWYEESKDEYNQSRSTLDHLVQAKIDEADAINKLNPEHYKGPRYKFTSRAHRKFTDVKLLTRQDNARITTEYQGRKFASHLVRIRFMYDVIPTYGSKLAGYYGDKGVITKMKPRAEMYKDKWGHIADIVTDGFPTINRMNPGRDWESLWNAICRDREEDLREDYRNGRHFEEIYKDLLDFYSVAAPLHLEKVTRFPRSERWRHDHVLSVVNGRMFMYLPQNTPNIGPDMLWEMLQRWGVRRDTVTFIGDQGTLIETKDPILIGEVAIMVLEKTGHDWSGCEAPKRQIHGIPGKMSQNDKYSLPYRKQPTRNIGESETRELCGECGSDFTADMIDRTNNPEVMMEMHARMLEADQPSNLPMIVNRILHPLGHHRGQDYLTNALYVRGVEFRYYDASEEK